MSNVLIEFTQATDKRARGERVWVDEKSARSFVVKKKVAKKISEKDLASPPAVDEDDNGDGETAVVATTPPAGGAS